MAANSGICIIFVSTVVYTMASLLYPFSFRSQDCSTLWDQYGLSLEFIPNGLQQLFGFRREVLRRPHL